MNTNEPLSAETSPELRPELARASQDVFASENVEKPSPPVRRQGLTGLVILWVVVLALAAALVWMWQDNKRRDLEWQTHTAQRLGVMENALEKASKEQTAREMQYENRQQLIQERTTALEWRVNEWQNSRQALEKLYRQLLPLRDEVTMREVEYRIRFAMQQLAMGGNVSAALAALQDADAELAALNRADLVTVKAALAQAVEALQRVPAFDMRGFLARFDRALDAINQMTPREIPVAMPEAGIAADEAAPWWRRLWAETKEAVLSMVRLRVAKNAGENIGESSVSKPFLAETALDRQELRLRLLSLRWMALMRQPMACAEAAAARDWLTQHFSEGDPAVQTLRSLLEELASSPLTVPLPEISPVLEALRLWRAEQAMAGANDADGL